MDDSQPQWNADSPRESLRAQAVFLNEMARFTFLRDKSHTELFFLYLADGQGAISQRPAGMENDQFVPMLKEAIRQNDIYGVIHIVEAWAYFPRRPNDHTFKQVAEGEIAVSELKPGDKSEALMVKVESRDGLTHVWLSPIIRSADGVALADPMEIAEPTGGRLGSLFPD
jgi:hypothetical protein